MSEVCRLFFELIQISLGNRGSLSRAPSDEEWDVVFAMAEAHAIAGIAFHGLDGLVKLDQQPPKKLLLEWIGRSEQIKYRSLLVDQRCCELEEIIKGGGFNCCVLKGQGTAIYYRDRLYRQSGDIDIWVTRNGGRKREDVRSEVLQFVKNQGYHVGHVDIKHSNINFFKDVPVEIHFIPSWMFSPFKNKKLQQFFAEEANNQFNNKDFEAGFTHTTIEFDLVYSLVHIYRHIFEEGVGLRQLLDYYNILLHSDKQQRQDAYATLKILGMRKFVGGVLYVMRECFGLTEEFFICELNKPHGKFLLSEILIAGNFGHYDDRYKHQKVENRLSNGLITMRRDIRYVCYYPSEVLWMPFWKLWHWFWRRRRGYI